MAEYSKRQALSILKEIINGGGTLFPSKHFKDRMAEREVDMLDVLNAIKAGKILREPEPGIKSGDLVYVVEGKSVDGRQLKIPFIINSDRMATFLTVMD